MLWLTCACSRLSSQWSENSSATLLLQTNPIATQRLGKLAPGHPMSWIHSSASRKQVTPGHRLSRLSPRAEGTRTSCLLSAEYSSRLPSVRHSVSSFGFSPFF